MAQYDGVFIQRMCTEIDADELLLLAQALDRAPRLCLGQRRRGHGNIAGHGPEKRVGSLALILLVLLAEAHDEVEENLPFGVGRQILLTLIAETVEATAECQTLKSLAVDILQADTLGKVVDIFIRSVGFPLPDDGGGSAGTHALDGREAKTDLTIFVHTKLHIALVDVRPQCRDVHRLAFLHEFGDLADVAVTACHQGSHVFCRVVSLEIGGLVGHPGIAGSVRLVESIGSELLPV